jgi:hypothetical protein
MRLAIGAALLVVIFAGPASADPIIGTTTDLHDSSPKTEQAWLQGLLGAGNTLSFVLDVQQPAGADGKSLSNYNPGVDWDYVIVKYGKNWTAFSDSPNDNLLSVDVSKGISHVDFFKNGGGSVSVPEPSVLMLVSAGLAVVTPLVWSRRRRA